MPGKIAVIYKENKYGEELAQYFRLKKLPFYSKRNINLFEQPFAKKVIHILRYIACELETPYSGDDLLFEIMHYDFYKIPPIEAARISIEVAEKATAKKFSIRKYLQDWNKTRNPTLFSLAPHEGHAAGQPARKMDRGRAITSPSSNCSPTS